MDSIIEIITNVGVPIAMMLVEAYAIKYLYDKNREDDKASNESISNLATAVNENTQTLALLVQKMEDKL